MDTANNILLGTLISPSLGITLTANELAKQYGAEPFRLTQEQYDKAISLIDELSEKGGELLGAGLAVLAEEVPVIGPIIGEIAGVGVGKIAGWLLKKLLSLVPHGDEVDDKPLNTPDKFKKAIIEAATVKPVVVAKSFAQVPNQPVEQLDNWEYYQTVVPIYDDGKKYIPGVQKINYYRVNPLNPTFDHPGF